MRFTAADMPEASELTLGIMALVVRQEREATALWLQTMAPLSAGDTVELQGHCRAADGYFAANHTSFWGAKIG